MKKSELNPIIQKLLKLLDGLNRSGEKMNNQLNVKQKGGFYFPAEARLSAGNRKTGSLDYTRGQS
jgi:hypothetical protein